MSAKRGKSRNSSTVLVIGLGRFGTAVAESLIRMGHEVLGVDEDAERVQRLTDRLTHLVQADTTNVETLRELGTGDFASAVVGIGSDVEASVLTTLALVDLGVPTIWAKATNERHGRILERTGAHHVVYPEARMGERVAHMVTGRMIDYIEFDDDFAIAKTRAPASMADMTLGDSAIRTNHGVTIVGIKRPREDFTYARPDTMLAADDLLIVSGRVDLVERFAALT
ncbi:potassium channel family protein [Sphingomonas sp. AX6]|uniref:potassium channel family protein n=1 Tax=Sphingomonas sp. AX6 TaxID=2653171 RepID=UPI0012F32CF2|nr:TrkA family potassium uptake protein [Sphingomonas sp. AX6]VXC55465.1 Potassium uptake protein, integral membrane component, KtrA [Sphingomonas sp. AX6]